MAKFHLQENETLIGSGLMACKHKKSPASQLFYINFLLKIVGETPARRARREITKASPSAICGCALGRLGCFARCGGRPKALPLETAIF